MKLLLYFLLWLLYGRGKVSFISYLAAMYYKIFKQGK
jgi:hypothetical protein